MREQTGVFRNREHAGEVLAEMLVEIRDTGTIVVAIPAGGVPVAAYVAEKLDLPLHVAVVSKISLPWDPEAGYGAVAFDDTVFLNEELISVLGLTEEQIREGVNQTRQRVQRRTARLREFISLRIPDRRPVIVVDDGLASGFTMLAAIKLLRAAAVGPIIVAVPTANKRALGKVAREADRVYCPNIRGGDLFAVAEAYERWSNVEDHEIERILSNFESF